MAFESYRMVNSKSLKVRGQTFEASCVWHAPDIFTQHFASSSHQIQIYRMTSMPHPEAGHTSNVYNAVDIVEQRLIRNQECVRVCALQWNFRRGIDK